MEIINPGAAKDYPTPEAYSAAREKYQSELIEASSHIIVRSEVTETDE